jgi:hypothetical protein
MPAVLAVVVLIGCKPVAGPFDDYRGVNLIGDLSLSRWTLDQGAEFMTCETVTSVPPPISSADVHRLEIRNLVVDGDFEQSPVGPGANGWTSVNGGGLVDTLEVIGGVSAHAINGHTMHVKTDCLADLIGFNLRDAAWGARDGFLSHESYNLLFDYRCNGPLVFEYHTAASLPDQRLHAWKLGGGPGGSMQIASFDNLNAFPGTFSVGQSEVAVGAEANAECSFGSIDPLKGKAQEAFIDNLRVVRTDIDCRARLSLKRESDTVQPLVPGQYKFSLYVHSDPDVGTTPNRFGAHRISLGILSCTTVATGTVATTSWSKAFHEGEDGLDFAVWTRLSITLEAGETDPGASDSTLELSICPTDDTLGAAGKDCGSILVSAPSLELIP